MLQKAMQILINNWEGNFTKPSVDLYPFQWSWDAGFCAIGYAHFDMEKAKTELRSLFSAQWDNGFLPHIVFHNDFDQKKYFPKAEFYETTQYQAANGKTFASGLTQPPVHGFVLEEMYNTAARNKTEISGFIEELFPKIFKLHQYLYENRDPYNEGLVYIRHNWESGTDNSAAWDGIWQQMDSTTPVCRVERKDTTHVNQSQRPRKREYDYYLHLIKQFAQWRYDDKTITEKSLFLIQDPLFNSVLAKSNQSLIKLAQIIHRKETIPVLQRWIDKTKNSLNAKLFCAEKGIYQYYDLRNKKNIDIITSSSFAPIFAEIPSKEQATRMVKVLLGNQFRGENNQCYLCPSLDLTHHGFEPQRYWRGPVWINVNWMIYRGLRLYGFNKLARTIKKETLQMVKEQGFYEYFEPDKQCSKEQKRGYGGSDFSWTAALCIDFLLSKK